MLCFGWGKTLTRGVLTLLFDRKCTKESVLNVVLFGTARHSSRDLQDTTFQWLMSVISVLLAKVQLRNNKICGGCHLKNYKALKHSRDEQNVEQASNAKKVKGNDNDMGDDVSSKVGDIEVQEMVDMTEKEGTAISVLFDLSLL